ncbi:MAG: sulfotransferase family protein [Calditrichaeota bacterium]|nr:MAG: sulfotransferase family protein [Calditrichota bacterium]
MYSFAQRKDTKVFDEPLYGFYLKNSNAKEYHPGAEDVLNSMETDGSKVVEMMINENSKPVHFFKNMTHHLLNLDCSFMKSLVNIILTRDPVEMLPSFAEVIENPTIDDVGYKLHTDLIKKLEEMKLPVIVIDSKSILLNPAKQLENLCNAIGIPFDNSMLSWKKGSLPEDGVWAKYWYKSVHNSTSFMQYKPKTKPFPKHLKPLLESCQPHYEALRKLSL